MVKIEKGMYCLEKGKGQTLQGSIKNIQNKEGSIYHKIVVAKCQESTRLPDDPPCAPDYQINAYLDGKYLMVQNIQN